MSHTGRLKLLLIAAGCDSAAVGEGGIAFEWVSRLGQRHDVTLLTSRASHRPPTAELLPHVRVVEWPDPPLFEKWDRFNAMLKPGYVNLYRKGRRWLKEQLRRAEKFDLIHQLMPMALRYPSPGAGLGIPLIIGPRGGSLDTPGGFSADFGRVPWYTQLRQIDEWRLRHDPWLRHTYASADCIIAVAPYVRDLLADLPSRKVEFMTETGIEQLPPPNRKRKDNGQVRLLFVGRVIRSKGVRDAIRAMAQLSDVEGLRLDVVGDGDDMAACQQECQHLGVRDRVTFHGMMPRVNVDRFYADADIFLFPSFREPSGIVVIEAMSHGLAMIVADRGGPGFVVDDRCGFRVPVQTPSQFATETAACIRKLAREPGLIESMGAAAREKIRREFLWDAKVDRLDEIYSSVLARGEMPLPQLG